MSETPSQPGAQPGAQPVGFQRAMITGSIMLATVMQALDITIANVALPHMQGSLSATQEQISWVLTSYIVAAAIMTPATGFLAARLGRKRLFALAITGFTAVSMLCGAASSLTELVLFRMLQGAFGAGLVPLSQAVLLDTYPRERHGSAMAIWGMGVMVGPILGPTLGGYLTEFYNWRWVFYINLPFGLLALAGILSFVPETRRDPSRALDWFGFALLGLAIGTLQLMLDRGQTKDWFASPEIVLEAVACALCLYLFVVHTLTAERPFLDPKLFADRNLVVGLCFIFVVGIILLATLALLPPFLQTLMGYPVLTTGLALAPRGTGTLVAMILVSRLINRVDVRLLILVGLATIAFSLWRMAGFTPDVAFSTLVWTGIVQGLGLGFVFVPLSTVTFATLAPRFRNDATAMFSLMRNIGSSIGTSIVITLLAQNTQIVHAGLVGEVTPLNPALAWPGVARFWNFDPSGLAALNQMVTRQAATVAYLDDFLLMMALALLAIPLLLLLHKPQPRGAPRESG